MAEPTLLPERLQYRPTKIELDESIEKAKATLLKKIKRSVYVTVLTAAAATAARSRSSVPSRPSSTSSALASRSCPRPVTPMCCCTPVP